MPKTRVGDLLLAYNDRGRGTIPVLLLHGFPLDKRMWEPQAFTRALRGFLWTPSARLP